jgi:hypothetical protein
MYHLRKENSSRKLGWVEGRDFAGWGCSECDWVFRTNEWPPGHSLIEVKHNFQMQLFQEFESHSCSYYERAKGSTPGNGTSPAC